MEKYVQIADEGAMIVWDAMSNIIATSHSIRVKRL